MHDTDAEQPTIQSRSQCSSCDDHIPSHERTCGRHHCTWVQPQVENWCVMKIAVTEVDGAIHWRMIRHKLKFTFMKQGGDTVIDRDSINHIWKEAAKHDFSIARIFLQHHCTFEQLKDPLLGEIWSNQRWCVILLHFSSGNNSYFTEDAHSIWCQSWRRDSLQGEQIAEKDDKLWFSIPWIPGETRLKNNSKVTCWTPERAHSKTE